MQIGRDKSGRGLDDLKKMIEMKVSFGTDMEKAISDTSHWAALALSAEEKMGVVDPREMERLSDAVIEAEVGEIRASKH